MTWDVTGLTYDSKSFTPVSSGGSDLQGFCLDDTGTRLYVLTSTAGWPEIDQHAIGTAFDISTAGAAIGTHSMSSPGHANIYPGTLWMNPTGTKIFCINNNVDGGTDNTELWEITMSTPFDITSVSGTVVVDINTEIGDFGFAGCMNQAGTRFYAIEGNTTGDGKTIVQYDMSVAFDISTLTAAGKTYDPVAQLAGVTNIEAGNEGLTILLSDSTGDVYQYVMSTADDLSTLSYDSKTYDLATDVAGIANASDFWVDPCSTKFYSYGNNGGIGDRTIYQWDMGTAAGCVGAVAPDTGCIDATYVEGGVVRLAVGSLNGLHWLGCQTVTALVDGNVTELEVCDGEVTFPRIAARAHIGLPYTTDIETLDIESNSGSTIAGGRKKVTDVTTRFYKSRLPLIGPNFFDMVQMKQRDEEGYGVPTEVLSGDKTTNLPPAWNSHGRVAYRMRDPVPLTILAVIPELEGEDD
jgi:hypothetical protein